MITSFYKQKDKLPSGWYWIQIWERNTGVQEPEIGWYDGNQLMRIYSINTLFPEHLPEWCERIDFLEAIEKPQSYTPL